MTERTGRSRVVARRRRRWFRLLSVVTPLLGLGLLEIGLRWLGIAPAALHVESQRSGFSPLVEEGREAWRIRHEWVNDGETVLDERGGEAGHLYLHPGFRSARILRQRAPGSVRVVAVGGSTTFGLFVGAEAAFPAVLGRRLEAQLEGRSVESINLGCPGWASDRVAGLIPTVLSLEPDLVVIYSGHNELLAGRPTEEARWGATELLGLAGRSAAVAWLRRWGRGAGNGDRTTLSEVDAAKLTAGRVPVFDPLLLPAVERSPPRPHDVEVAATRYADQLGAAVSLALRAGAPVLLVQPARNLLMPPAVSAHPPGFADEARFSQLQTAAGSAFEAGKLERALALVGRAIDRSPEFAMTHYWRGVILSLLGRRSEALEALRRAADTDGRTHRTTTANQRALVALAEQLEVPLVDPEPELLGELPPGESGGQFVDHCHPTVEGHRRIAELLVPAALDLLAQSGSSAAAAERASPRAPSRTSS